MGFVSSKRRLYFPPSSSATPKLMAIALAWPMCRNPFGSGGKRVWTRPSKRPAATSASTAARMKSLGSGIRESYSRSGERVLRVERVALIAWTAGAQVLIRPRPGEEAAAAVHHPPAALARGAVRRRVPPLACGVLHAGVVAGQVEARRH